MADSFIQVAPDSTGKQLQTYLNTISAQPVHAEAVVLVDSSGVPITSLPVTGPLTDTQLRAASIAVTGPITNTELRASEVAVSGTIAATQSGTWNVGTLTSITNPVTVAAGTNLNTSLLATATGQTGGAQKTQIVDGTGAVIGSTANALNVFIGSIMANAGTNLNTTNVSVKILQGAATLASGQVTMSNVSTTIAASRPTRRSATVRNQDATNSGYIGPAPIGTANGLLLYPGDSISVDFTGVIAGISASTSNVTFGYLETYD